MLRWRLLSAAVIISVLVTLVTADHQQWLVPIRGFWLLPVLLLIAVMATEEVLELLRHGGHTIDRVSTHVGVLAIVLAAALPMVGDALGTRFPENSSFGRFGWPAVAASLGLIVAFTRQMQLFVKPATAMVSLSLSVMVMIYIGGMLGFLASLRLLDNEPLGIVALVSLLFITKLADTGAYTVGKNLGKHKLTPVLSPGKTVEGAIGGFVFAIVGGLVYFRAIAPLVMGGDWQAPSIVGIVIYSLLVAVLGMIGDLAESLLKRDMQRKDSSRWLPGLGGVLDIIDSVLLAAPVAYLCWESGLLS
ncbi:phosphatidate cytidylyltransferase [Pirellula staleyi DSM 6068]|uniref:Phosphatidate cytidylyltransferase n=1 Tax=Pirellula staleyi (strain ATCC 27377 / DSM 6068 / ICPB 4128) TaxID=530564 RepID=D2R0C5_PIRSD|nr:phosphatidate cytidylyltransferase [Pirellula staleyi]ADB14793.1 phosphatidate cytidylyltransferase [Pirellula staleyi DSM 6068]